MNRRAPQPSKEQSFHRFLAMYEAQDGLKLLLAKMPPGSTLADARRLREKIIQTDRTPCSFLDGPLGIAR